MIVWKHLVSTKAGHKTEAEKKPSGIYLVLVGQDLRFCESVLLSINTFDGTMMLWGPPKIPPTTLKLIWKVSCRKIQLKRNWCYSQMSPQNSFMIMEKRLPLSLSCLTTIDDSAGEAVELCHNMVAKPTSSLCLPNTVNQQKLLGPLETRASAKFCRLKLAQKLGAQRGFPLRESRSVTVGDGNNFGFKKMYIWRLQNGSVTTEELWVPDSKGPLLVLGFSVLGSHHLCRILI